jgi:hypothetical protein
MILSCSSSSIYNLINLIMSVQSNIKLPLPYKLCIGLLTKNCAKWMSAVLLNVELYASFFQDYNCYIVDGHSTDETRNICETCCSNEDTKRLFVHQNTQSLPRGPSLVEARSMVIDYFKPQFNPQTLLLLLDSDSPNSVAFDIDGFLKPFIAEQDPQNYSLFNTKWKALFANQAKCYYDVWALRDEVCKQDWQIEWRVTGDINCHKKYQHPKSKSLGLWPVQSAFGGAALYRTEYINEQAKYFDTQYLRLQNNTTLPFPVCEHVPFNFSIGSPMYINCEWIIGDHE